MASTKRGLAINGDEFTLNHPRLALESPFTSFIDVASAGVTYQAFVARDRNAFNYANTTGEFSVAGFRGYIIETLDAVNVQMTHRYQALVDTPTGVLSVHSYDSVEQLLNLVGSLRPDSHKLGVTLDPDDEAEFASVARVAVDIAQLGIVEITPLTAQVIDQLPTWQGTRVDAGELYAGRFTNDAPYLTLVTETCRVLVMPTGDQDEDAIAERVAEIDAVWHP